MGFSPQLIWPVHIYFGRSTLPRLLDITAYGLEGTLWWAPVRAYKVNWQVEDSTRTENLYAPIVLRLVHYEHEGGEYALELEPGPSLIAFPGPGCWVLRLERGDEHAETTQEQLTVATLQWRRAPSGQFRFVCHP